MSRASQLQQSSQKHTSVFFAHSDNTLTVGNKHLSLPPYYLLPHLHQTLVLYSLLYDRLVSFDAMFMNNPVLKKLLMDPEYERLELGRLVSAGNLVPLLRTDQPSFADVANLTMVRTATRHVKPFADFLDLQVPTEAAGPARYSTSELATEFTVAAKQMLSDSVLSTLGLGNVSDPAQKLLQRMEASVNPTLSRSALFNLADTVDKAGSHDDAERLRVLSSALYHRRNYAKLDLHPAYPGRYMSALAELETLEPLDGDTSGREEDTRIDDPIEVFEHELPWISAGLRLVDFNFIQEAKQSPEYKEYRRTMLDLDSPRSDDMRSGKERATAFNTALYNYAASLEFPLSRLVSNKKRQLVFDSLRIATKISQLGTYSIEAVTSVSTVTNHPLPQTIQMAGVYWTWGSALFDYWASQLLDTKQKIAIAESKSTYDPDEVNQFVSLLRSMRQQPEAKSVFNHSDRNIAAGSKSR